MEMTHFPLSLSELRQCFNLPQKKPALEDSSGKLAKMGAKKRLGGAVTRREGDTLQRGHHKVLFRLGRGIDRDKADIFKGRVPGFTSHL